MEKKKVDIFWLEKERGASGVSLCEDELLVRCCCEKEREMRRMIGNYCGGEGWFYYAHSNWEDG